MGISKKEWGKVRGQPVALYTLGNIHGHLLKLSDLGATIIEIQVPDQAGVLADVNLGFATPVEYLKKTNPYFGAMVGRVANRINAGKFSLDGQEYTLACNDNGENHLHGGIEGFHRHFWQAEEINTEAGVAIKFTRVSPNGEEGYPGRLEVSVTYTWTDQSEVIMDYEAHTDAATHVNLTNHAYLNLAGHDQGSISDHQITIASKDVLEKGPGCIPTGRIRSVDATSLDLRESARIGDGLDNLHPSIEAGDGYDHCYLLKEKAGPLEKAAEVYDPQSGRLLTVLTTEPSIQFYTGNLLDGSAVGKTGTAYHAHSGFCLEAQHFPDSPNQAHFPSTRLNPGSTYSQKTIYHFSVRND